MSTLFPSLVESMESKELSMEDINKTVIPTFTTIEYQVDAIVDKISNINNLDENEIKNIIIRQHNLILNYDLFLASSSSREQAQILFTNKKFLRIFLDIIGLIELPRHEIICINKLAYDYYISPGNDPEISKLLMQMSWQINNVLVIKLSGKLGVNGARMLAMIANSSFKEEKNIHRINTFLVKCELALSVQDIVDIYCMIFDRVSNLFIHTMLEIKPCNLTESQLKRFDGISLAILAILDSMPRDEIKKVLYSYAFTLKLMPDINKVRFSLKSALSYTRLQELIKEVELDPIDELKIP